MGSLSDRIATFMTDVMRRGPLTQRALAGLLGISQGRLSTYLNEKELPGINVIVKLAEIGGVTVDELIKSTKDPQIAEGAYSGVNIKAPVKSSVVLGPGSTQTGTININSRVIQRREYQPKKGDISSEQARVLKDLVDKVVETEQLAKKKPSTYPAVWNALNRRMGVTYYREIPEWRFEEAVVFLEQWLGRLKRRRWVDPEAWRKEMYAAVFAKTKMVGYSKVQVDNMILERFGRESIRDLNRSELQRLNEWANRLVAQSKGKRRAGPN